MDNHTDIDTGSLTPDNITQLISRFVRATITDDELHQLSAWAHKSEENRQFVGQLAELIFSNDVANDSTTYNIEKALERFRRQVGISPNPHRRISLLRKLLASTAAVAAVAAMVMGGFWVGKSDVKSQFTDIVITAPTGSQTTVTLPDGSTVELNSNSQLTYSQGFGINDRTVRLKGEGLFRVKHQDKAFQVITDGMTVTDMGTAFKAHDYEDEETATVDLINGAVDVANRFPNGTHCQMKPAQRFIVNKRTGEISRHSNEASILETDINSLNFIDTPLYDIARQLSRAYGVRINVSPKLRDVQFFGFYNRKEDSLHTILNSMAKAGLIHYKADGRTYTLY